jgi:hypothetical protein
MSHRRSCEAPLSSLLVGRCKTEMSRPASSSGRAPQWRIKTQSRTYLARSRPLMIAGRNPLRSPLGLLVRRSRRAASLYRPNGGRDVSGPAGMTAAAPVQRAGRPVTETSSLLERPADIR